jgi:hypothetical protein
LVHFRFTPQSMMKVIASSALLVIFTVSLFKLTAPYTTSVYRSSPTSGTTLQRHSRPWKNSIQRPQRSHYATSATPGKSTTAIHSEGKKDAVTYDGSGRGRYLFVLVLFICIWQFSIPPSFRRAKFCPPPCVEERTLCRTPCVTFDEWTSDIVQYYKDGGGIQWDFSIDPNTIAENEQFMENLFGSKVIKP